MDKNSGGGREFRRRLRIPEHENSGGREFRRTRISEDKNSGGREFRRTRISEDENSSGREFWRMRISEKDDFRRKTRFPEEAIKTPIEDLFGKGEIRKR